MTSIELGTPEAYVHQQQGFDSHDLITDGYVTAKERVTRLTFWSMKKQSFDIVVRCRQPNCKNKSNHLQISVNGKKLGEEFLTNTWSNIPVHVPRKRVQKGENIVTLETPAGTTEPDIFFDLQSIVFKKMAPGTIVCPEITHSSDGIWTLQPGEILAVYHSASGSEQIRIDATPRDSGLFYVEWDIAGKKLPSQWLISLGAMQSLSAGITTDNLPNHNGIGTWIKTTIGNPQQWPCRETTVHVTHAPSKQSPDKQQITTVTQQQIDQPNIVVITLDSLRCDSIGAYGNPHAVTPIMDQLSKRGFQRLPSIAAAPYTTSSVASLFTGVTPDIHQVYQISEVIPERLTTLAERFQQAGYSTFGINAMPSINGSFGFSRGFDSYLNLFEELTDEEHSLVNGDRVIQTVTDTIQSRAAKSPFFMYIHMREPHLPYTPKWPFNSIFSDSESWNYLMEPSNVHMLTVNEYSPSAMEITGLRSLYDGGVRYGDSCLGEIIRIIQGSVDMSRTLLVVQSDHGEAFYEHQYFFHNNTVFEEMVSIPMIYAGAMMDADSDRRILGSSGTTDLTDELLAAGGVSNSLNQKMKNRSAIPYWQQSHGIGVMGPIAFYRYPMKFIGQSLRPDFAQLYNLRSDPGERHNLLDSHSILKEWYQSYIEFRSSPRLKKSQRVKMSGKRIRQLQALGYLN